MKPYPKHSLVALAGLSLVAAVPASAAVMYHDFGATTGEESTGFITTHQSGASNQSRNTPDLTQKALINYATGVATGVLFSIDGANGMDSRTGQIAPPTAATPAAALFNVPGLNLDNGIFYIGNVPGNTLNVATMTITLTGLNPLLTYDFAL